MVRWLTALLVSVTWLCSAGYGQPFLAAEEAYEEAAIEQELDQLTQEVAQRLKRIAELQAQLQADKLALALEGYCPVSLVKQQAWVRGDSKFRVRYEGISYLLADKEKAVEFFKDPQRYVPLLAGYDPVLWQDEGKRVRGKRQFGWFYRDRYVLLASDATLRKFEQHPQRYFVVEEEPDLAQRAEFLLQLRMLAIRNDE